MVATPALWGEILFFVHIFYINYRKTLWPKKLSRGIGLVFFTFFFSCFDFVFLEGIIIYHANEKGKFYSHSRLPCQKGSTGLKGPVLPTH